MTKVTLPWPKPTPYTLWTTLKSTAVHTSIKHTVGYCCNWYKKAVLSQRWPRDAPDRAQVDRMSRCGYGHSKLSKMAACRQLGFDVNGNSAIRPADPENPTLEPNMKCIGSPVCCGDMAIRVSWGHMEPPFWGMGGRRGSAMAPFERAMLVSYRL